MSFNLADKTVARGLQTLSIEAEAEKNETR
jgi:hypothetical protein